MNCTITGVIKTIGEIIRGKSKGTGKDYSRRVFSVEEPGQYPNTVAFELFNEKAENTELIPGATVTVTFFVESKLFNDKWYSECKATKVELVTRPSKANQKSQDDEMKF